MKFIILTLLIVSALAQEFETIERGYAICQFNGEALWCFGDFDGFRTSNCNFLMIGDVSNYNKTAVSVMRTSTICYDDYESTSSDN
jgi:hypothetical protein